MRDFRSGREISFEIGFASPPKYVAISSSRAVLEVVRPAPVILIAFSPESLILNDCLIKLLFNVIILSVELIECIESIAGIF